MDKHEENGNFTYLFGVHVESAARLGGKIRARARDSQRLVNRGFWFLHFGIRADQGSELGKENRKSTRGISIVTLQRRSESLFETSK